MAFDFCGDCGHSFDPKTDEWAKHLPTCKKRGPMCYIWKNNYKHRKPCHPSLGSSIYNKEFIEYEDANRIRNGLTSYHNP